MEYIKKHAEISTCTKYRYSLEREWISQDGGKGNNYILYIALNPSTADAEIDDPTLTRCVVRAKSLGYKRLKLVNLFAFRSTNPAMLHGCDDPVGPNNDKTITTLAKDADKIILCWGDNGSWYERDKAVLELLKAFDSKLYCLKRSKLGIPRHPSRLSYEHSLEKYTA